MRDTFAACLGLVIVGSLIILIGGLMFYPIAMEAAQTQLLNNFMVMLATMAAGVVTFYFGSSSSGKVKDETIQLLAKTSPTSPTSPTVATVENMAANTAANTASTTENTIKTAENTAAVLATSKAEGDGE